jgi:NAD(P)-dependent dehydrogenase (short-subunit alcohol dehydrogenase family)
MADLTDKIAVITGAASGIGEAGVETFVAAGARVVAADIQEEAGRELETRFGADRVRYVRCDVTVQSDLEAAMALAADAFGGLDILFNNAGAGGTPATVEDFDSEGFDRAVALLLKSVFVGTHAAVPYMKQRGGGSVINTASIAGVMAGWGPIIYSVCKAGVVHFTRLAAAELSHHRIRVNAIAPGFIATSIFGSAIGQGPDEARAFARTLAETARSTQPLGRVGEGIDIAEAAAFLASDAASFISGIDLVVDGALTTGPEHAWRRDVLDPVSQAMGLTVDLRDAMMAAMRKS